MFQNQIVRSAKSCRSSLKAVEADIQHANSLAVSIKQAYGGACIQMRLSYNSLAPIFLFLLQWMEFTCIYNLPSYFGLLDVLVYKVYTDGNSSISTFERKAGLREFYGVIYPSLQQLESNLIETKQDAEGKGQFAEIRNKMSSKDYLKFPDKDVEREKECGICMEACTKMVLPNCNHAMCINCYRDWNSKSQSCPFCRDSLKRVASRDLWLLTPDTDVVDTMTLVKENLRNFYMYINKLPLAIPDSLFFAYYEYLV